MSKEAEALIAGLEEELALYRQMLEISNQQVERGGDVEFLFSALKKKQDLVLKIQSVDDRLTELKMWWKQNREGLPGEEKERIVALFDEIEAVVKRLLELEGVLVEQVQRDKDRLEADLSQVNAGKKAVKAYYGKGIGKEARFVDRRQ